MKLKNKLIITFLFIALLPSLIIGITSTYVASQSIEQQAFAQLTAVRDIKTAQVTSYFNERKGDIEVLARSVSKLLSSSQLTLAEAAHQHHDYFSGFIQSYGYYDFFLVDENGDVFYSVTKEADYQSNLITGPYANSGLGKAFNTSINHQAFAMEDFSRYAPSNNEPASFISLAAQINGESVVIALQLSIDSINQIMQQRSGMGETGETYLVGSDLLMRSDSYLDPQGHSVIASFAGNVSNNGVDTTAAKLAIAGNSGTQEIIDYNGNPVLSAYTPIDIHGIRWALLSEIDVAEAFAAIDELYFTISLVILLCVLVVIATAVYVAKTVTKPLGGEPNDMVDIANTIADGDLTIEFEQGDSASGVYLAMNKMSLRLQAMISEIVDDSNSLASSSEECSVASLQASNNLAEQQKKIEQLATAIQQMSASISEVANNASQVATSVHNAQQQSGNSNQQLQHTITDINQLDQEIGEAHNVILALEQESHNISAVLEVIRGIAEQTNLLALNAAIEAARAGEQGRGFAVVADEVRTLAEKTQESTKSIEEMISNLQSSSQQAVKVMATSHTTADNTLNNANLTGEAINTIHQEIDNILQMSELIASAVEQQAGVCEEINQNITVINDVAYENSASANQVTAASQSISEVAAQLNQLSLQFKV
ncbi:methyl-accepting chemotaxis protein [Thalassotalea montiporae]